MATEGGGARQGLVFSALDSEELELSKQRGSVGKDVGILPLLVHQAEQTSSDLWLTEHSPSDANLGVPVAGKLLSDHLLGTLKISDAQPQPFGSPDRARIPGARRWRC